MSKLLLMGLPDTGKTTFLSAFWHITESAEIDCSLLIEKLDDDMEYLNKITEQWLAYKEVDRTTGSTYKDINLKMKDKLTDQKFNLFIPDLSGEIFRSQWEHREWSKKYNEIINDLSGILIFISPKTLEMPITIKDVNDVIGPEQKEDESKIIKWSPEKSPTQVIYVDLIQFLLSHVSEVFRISIIISAWDLILNKDSFNPDDTTPSNWLKQNLPLLDQFLYSNFDEQRYKIFGVSAQGGDYEKDDAKLKKISKPSERVIVMDNKNKMCDITQPVKWLLS